MKTPLIAVALVPAALGAAWFGATRDAPPPASRSSAPPSLEEDPAPSVARGRHLVQIAGCNDCHTPGFAQDPSVDEGVWLVGDRVGWRGPWGTSYASNLRRHAAAFADPELWVRMIRGRQGLPPMPWASLQAMTDNELRSIHAYLRSLPVTGDVTPAPLAPDAVPTTPYFDLVPVVAESSTRSSD